jgi:5-methylcytosine-specific restriction endonuclease McrA
MTFNPVPKPKHRRRVPKRKERGRIKPETYHKVYERDGGVCVICGRGIDLEMHHVIYRSRGGSGEEHNLVLLCKKHHQAAHRNSEVRYRLEEHMRRLYPEHWKESGDGNH